MLNARSIQGIFILSIGLFVAIWLGLSIATNQSETVIQFAGAGLLITCILLGRRIWLLLILFMALNVPLIRGFGTAELGQALFIGFTVVIFLMRRQPLHIKFGELECWMLLLAACILQVYLRNPVGLGLFGAGDVGGKPYFMVTMAFLTGAILGNIVVAPSEIKWYMRLTIIGSFLGVGLTALRMRGGLETGYVRSNQMDDGRSSGRIGALGGIGASMARVIACYISPLRALLHPGWALLILISAAAAAGSGYRNAVASVGLFYLVGIAYRGGLASVLTSIIAGAMALGILAVVNVTSPLPPNIQRALSPFPGTWEERYVEAADESTEWRVEMWKEALFTDYWIHDKILGDGLGLTAKEVILINSVATGGQGLASMGSGMSAQQESMMITGGYHSGPVQCVRIVGYIGLLVVILAMIRVAVHAHRQIIRCRGTEWFSLALFTGIPVISLPFIYVFIFGDFGRDVSAVFISYGIIRLLEKNLPLPAYVKSRHVPYILKRGHVIGHASPTSRAIS